MAESVFFQQGVENSDRVAAAPLVDEAAATTRQTWRPAGALRPSQVPVTAATTRQPGPAPVPGGRSRHPLQRRRPSGGALVAQLKGNTEASFGADLSDVRVRTGGGPLPESVKAGVERISGIAMDDVNVHYNSPQPAQVLALAYTQGTDIHVAPGQERHLAHELWHVVQQKQGRVPPISSMTGMAVNDDPGLEREAEEMGTKAVGGKSDVPPLDRLTGTLSAGQDTHMNSGSAGLYPIQRVGPEVRLKTKAARFNPADPRGRTRNARSTAAFLAGANLPLPQRNLALVPFRTDVNGTYLWDGFSRPSWGGADEDFYAKQDYTRGLTADGRNRREYACVVDDKGAKKDLPRKQFRDPGEDFASIGHIEQWRDYIVNHATTERWTVEGGGEILAISQDEANRWYRDENNFELQSQSYNSSVALAYSTSDEPGQSWIS